MRWRTWRTPLPRLTALAWRSSCLRTRLRNEMLLSSGFREDTSPRFIRSARSRTRKQACQKLFGYPSRRAADERDLGSQLFGGSLTACCGASSDFCQDESVFNSFMDLAIVSVLFPRSFSYKTPSAPTTKVFTPDERYSAGYATNAKPPVILPSETSLFAPPIASLPWLLSISK